MKKTIPLSRMYVLFLILFSSLLSDLIIVVDVPVPLLFHFCMYSMYTIYIGGLECVFSALRIVLAYNS